MLNEIITLRMSLTGVTQAKLAEHIGATPSQVGLFLKGKASLNNASLQRCFEVLDINIEVYLKRHEIALEVVAKLKESKLKIETIVEMSKVQMIDSTGKKELVFLIDVSTTKEFDAILNSGIIDIESTFPFFKAIVLHLFQVDNKFTPKAIETSFGVLGGILTMGVAMPFFGGIIGAVASLSYMAIANSGKNLGFVSPLITLARNLIN